MFCGHVEEFRDMAAGVPVPIIVAGGPCKTENSAGLLEELQNALDAGAAGVAYGRRVWGSSDPEGLIRQISEVMFSD